MGIFSIANQHIRFAVKLACAIVLALFVGFHFQLETPRWAVLTAAIVAAGPVYCAANSLQTAFAHCLNQPNSTPDLTAAKAYLAAQQQTQ